MLEITRSVASRWMLTLFVRSIVKCSAPGDVQVTPANERPAFAPLDQSEPSVDNNKDISAVKPDGNISNCILTTYDDTLMSRVNIKPIAKYFSDGDKK